MIHTPRLSATFTRTAALICVCFPVASGSTIESARFRLPLACGCAAIVRLAHCRVFPEQAAGEDCKSLYAGTLVFSSSPSLADNEALSIITVEVRGGLGAPGILTVVRRRAGSESTDSAGSVALAVPVLKFAPTFQRYWRSQ
jgi:hypothetical protein